MAVDLRFLHGPSWERSIVACAATTALCVQLRDIAAGNAVGLLGHHYARHLEDLHAAGTVAPAVAAAYGLHDAGRRFLTPSDTDLWQYADKCHRLLDKLALSPAENDTLVADVTEAHRMYLAVLGDLGRSWT